MTMIEIMKSPKTIWIYLLIVTEFSRNVVTETTSTATRQLTETSPSIMNDCLVPPDLPDPIRIYYKSTDQEIFKGTYVAPFSAVTYKCESKYTLEGETHNFCKNGTWTVVNHPTCVKFCSPTLLSGITIKSKCEINGTAVSCLQPVRPNTTATIECAFGYQRPVDRFVIDVIHCEDDGEWDYHAFRCEQICGLEAPESTSLTIGGNLANVTKAPWHVGIYSSVPSTVDHFSQICGGTILSAKIVVSAAHCFWDNSEDKFYDPSNFKVAAGKYYRELHATEQLSPQIINVAQIIHEQEYNDYRGFFNHDIVLLTLVDYIEFKPYIKPICVETGLTFNEKNVEPGLIGRVAGWGFVSSSGESSPELKVIDLPTIEYKVCKQNLSAHLRQFITGDKFCAGYTNGMSVCRGDTGGGLVFSKRVGQNEVYFLRGIVSVGGSNVGSCSSYTLLTNIQYYIEMIGFYEIQNRPK